MKRKANANIIIAIILFNIFFSDLLLEKSIIHDVIDMTDNQSVMLLPYIRQFDNDIAVPQITNV